MSLFLPQILFKSSSSASYSSPSIATKQIQCQIQPLQPLYSSALTVPDEIRTLSSAYTPANAVARVASSSVATIDDELDEHDSESEGFENLMEELAAKSNASRNPSKRARAAEVHNLTEKRRRSRINEKMKALQKLIPNSNKTDKASMLDEAIEYLKQLQLRVQMLTMRNGMNSYSMSVYPGVLQPHQLPHSRIGLNEHENTTSLNQERDLNPMLSFPVECTERNQPSIHDFSHINNSGTSYSFRECLISSSGSERAQLMNSLQKQVLRADMDRNCIRNI
ncbi:hypothetical protein QVD17_36812 [Tagetes erecta]|uniref:BHLH domain-containing protein n=1 Tax=Tagetes erecta TaxID=13708 RepID=A0AAD8JX28_TARER|nr:hypothetical protein QVD17_36812 [Tagetes erecta]